MAIPEDFSFTRYLEAKKSVDDRALNGRVWQVLADHLPASSRERPLRVLEAGAGIGTMIERMLDENLFRNATYTAVDIEKENKAGALERLRAWSDSHGIALSAGPGDSWKLTGTDRVIDVSYVNEDFFDFAARHKRNFDLIVACAFLDITDISATLPLMFDLLDDNGVFYFPINFDGVTIFEPVIDPELDHCITDRYHHSMDRREINGKPSGNSRTGRYLSSCLDSCGANILASGESDWIVCPGPDGYPGDEAYFLHFIVHLVHETLKDDPRVDSWLLEHWIAERHRQVEGNQLVYIARNLDFVGRKNSVLPSSKAQH
jgi:hypothetical protein